MKKERPRLSSPVHVNARGVADRSQVVNGVEITLRCCEQCGKEWFRVTRRDKTTCGRATCRKRARVSHPSPPWELRDGQWVIAKVCSVCRTEFFAFRADAETHPQCRQVKYRKRRKEREKLCANSEICQSPSRTFAASPETDCKRPAA